MGFAKPEDAINDQIFFWGDTFKIVGVVKNYHQESLKKAFDALIFRYDDAPGGYYSVKFNTQKVKESMAQFELAWKEIFPGNPFHYFFLDEHYNKQYQADQQFGNIFSIFSGLAIFIACLGLFGLSSLTALQRTKEIGIRMAVGASRRAVLAQFLMEAVLISTGGGLLGIIVGVSGPLIAQWLVPEFGVAISPLSVIVAFFVSFAVGLVFGMLPANRASQLNPIEALRYE